jgi:hypothetical protein
METNIIVQNRNIENAIELSIIQDIHEIRGKRVILDFDLAKRYEVETKNLNLSVKRNLRRFPSDFMFQLTPDEWNSLRLQNETSKRGGRRYMPYAFTQEGVATLSGLLNSDIAIDTNIKIMRAFVAIRQYLMEHVELKHELDNFMRETNLRLDDNEVKVNDVFKMLSELFENKKAWENRQLIGFNRNND